MSTDSRVVLITGCSKGGIGYRLSEEFASRGCVVYATSRRLDSMEGLSETYPNIRTKELDVCSDESVDRATQEILAEAGRIDIVFSNAGVLQAGPILDESMDRVRSVFETNTFGTLRLARAIIPHMAASSRTPKGQLVVMGSVSGIWCTPWSGTYCASKAALHSIVESLKMECRPLDVKVTLIASGSFKSELASKVSKSYEMAPNSLYKNYSDAIVRRIWFSQTSGTMPADVYATRVVDQILKANPPSDLFIGGNTIAVRIVQWLPKWVGRAFAWYLFGKAK